MLEGDEGSCRKMMENFSEETSVKTEYRYYGLKRGLGRRTEVSEVGERRRGTREDVVRGFQRSGYSLQLKDR